MIQQPCSFLAVVGFPPGSTNALTGRFVLCGSESAHRALRSPPSSSRMRDFVTPRFWALGFFPKSPPKGFLPPPPFSPLPLFTESVAFFPAVVPVRIAAILFAGSSISIGIRLLPWSGGRGLAGEQLGQDVAQLVVGQVGEIRVLGAELGDQLVAVGGHGLVDGQALGRNGFGGGRVVCRQRDAVLREH